MKNILNKITAFIDIVYGWGIMICLFVGGATFFGYIAAFIAGGEAAAQICSFIYKQIFPCLIYGGNIIVLLGLFNMYLRRQKSLTVNADTSKHN